MSWARAFVAASALGLLMAGPAFAEIKIGYLAALSGAVANLTGESAFYAAKMAAEEFGGQINGEKIAFISADHLGKPDVGLGLAREWLDQDHVNLFLEVDNSAVALALSTLIKDRNAIMLTGSSSSKLLNESCGPHQAMMLLDTTALARAITIPAVKAGQTKWFFITVDFAVGHDLEAKGIAAVEDAGGKVFGSVTHPVQATDFSAFLLKAQASGADTIALATFGAYQNTIAKQAKEFGVDAILSPYYLDMTDIKAAGLDTFQNVTSATQFYWDQNDATREFSKRFEKGFGRPPTFTNADTYEFTRHYLKAVAATHTTDADTVMKWMRANPMQMINGSTSTIREDGYTLRDAYTYRTKTPQESKGDWDYLKITGTVSADTIAPPLEKSTCYLVKH